MPCLQALPASLEVQIAKKVQGWWYVCGFSRDVPVREGTGRKQGRLGLLHVRRELGTVGDGEAPGGNLKPASFQGPGSRQ